ncbi:DNA alkylation repair protein [Nocardiopsis exhalans]|uniref:DNA alkylation repair protein n=1 Tax=Nocardiopsis exhalans TaxID=163604 RepID=A0ABY5D353_9ACTN|nr:DNA alkylation repair protein [Nocardiopsis exhalans]USY18812.1 DNA alkylation repair protein [Nocardiopsis exhalans]
MADDLTAEAFLARLDTHRSEEELRKYQRYFRFDADAQDPLDYFVGVRMGTVFALAKEFVDMDLDQIEALLESPVHEARAGALRIMEKKARRKGATPEQVGELADLYLRRHDRVNDWDLVDLAAYHVVGRHLRERSRKVLYELARSENPWQRRTSIVATAHFIGHEDLDDTFAIAELLLGDDHELVQKATGWMLRSAGDVDPDRLLAFLDTHAARAPRPLLRAAIEKLPPEQRAHYRGLRA